ncbi:MAG TPA: hypothetical protein VHN18_00905 [Micromonosporaceae bacterium]|nr:hypothetical protein [Micromonosporaceae bacterium]
MAEPAGPVSAAGRWRLRHLPALLLASGAVLVAATLIGGLVRGGAGAAGAAIGVGVVILSYTLSTLVIAWADAISPQLVLPFGLGVYVAKFSLFGGLMILVGGSDWAGLLPMAWGIVAGGFGWTVAQIWWIATVHTRAPDRA